MAKIISASIDLNKIDKTRIKPHANGAKYYNIQIFLNDTADNYGNTVSIADNQTKEERDSKAKKNYLGNGKVVYNSDATPLNQPTKGEVISQHTKAQEDNDLPF